MENMACKLDTIFWLLMYIAALQIVFFIYHRSKIHKIMSTQDQFNAQLDRIEAATGEVATELNDLKGQIAGQGMPAAVEDAVLARLTAAADKLQGIAVPAPAAEPAPADGAAPAGQ